MKKIISVFLALVLLVGACSALVSCGAPKNAGPEIAVYLGEEIYDFDPTDYYVDSNAEQVMSLLFEPLFVVDEKGKLKKDGMADDYDVNEEERTIIIELRESYWSDEIRVKAEDYVHAWRDILLEPTNSNPAAALLYDIENAVKVKNGEMTLYDLGLEATDTYEITITYREGADYEQLLKNLSCVATAPVRQDIATEFNETYWTKFVNTAVTNGPFRIDSIDYETGSFTVARNLGYHQDPAEEKYTDEVTANKLISFFNVDGYECKYTYADLENKTVFYMSDASLADRAANKDSAMVADDLSTYTYVFNTEKELFAIKEVRQALSMAIDRNAIISAITFGKAATGFIPYACKDAGGDSFRAEDLISTSAKLEEAKALLEDVDLGGISKRFTLTVNNDEESRAIAEIVAAAWEELGFTVKVDYVDVRRSSIMDFANNETVTISDSELQSIVKSASRGDRDFDVIAVDWQMYTEDAFVALAAFANEYSGCGKLLGDGVDKTLASFGGYTSAEYDELIRRAYLAINDETRNTVLHEAEKLLVDSACIVPLVFNQNFVFVNSDISEIEVNGLGNFVLNKMEQEDYEKYLD